MMGQLPSGSGWSMPSQARRVEALAPAWPIWMPNFASVFAWIQSAMRRKAAVCPGRYRPGQPGVMRPSALTQAISANTRPAPPMARAPRCTRW